MNAAGSIPLSVRSSRPQYVHLRCATNLQHTYFSHPPISLKLFSNVATQTRLKTKETIGIRQNLEHFANENKFREANNAHLQPVVQQTDYVKIMREIASETKNIHEIAYVKQISALARAGIVGGMCTKLDEMRGQGIKPSIWTYNLMLSEFSKRRRMHQVNMVLEYMKQDDVKKNATTYSFHLKSLFECRYGQGMQEEWDQMISEGIQPNFYSIAYMLWNLKKTSPEEVDNFFQQVKNLQRNRIDMIGAYTLTMEVLQEMGDWNRVPELLKTMKDEGLPPTLRIYNVVYLCLCKAGRLKEAEELWREMEEKQNCHPNEQTYATRMISVREDIGEMERLLKEMEEKGIALTDRIYTLFLVHHAEKGDVRMAEQYFKKCNGVSKGEPNAEAYHALARAYIQVQKYDLCFKVLDDFQLRKIPTTQTLQILITACGRSNKMSSMFKYIRTFREVFKILPNIDCLTAMVEGFCINRDFTKAARVLQTMVDQNIPWTTKMCGMLVHSLKEKDIPLNGRGIWKSLYKATVNHMEEQDKRLEPNLISKLNSFLIVLTESGKT